MVFFTKDTKEDALKQLEKINQEMRAISALMHLNYNMIDGRNRDKVKVHFNNIVGYGSKYDKIKNSLSIYDKLELESTYVDMWNGKHVDVTTWEFWFRDVMNRLYHDINY